MAVIDPEGLFYGERLKACSDRAKDWWPRLYLASNGNARLELSYAAIVGTAFNGYRLPPTEDELWEVIEEFATNYLIILYQANGSWWAQFHTSEKYLPRYKTKRDEASPAPPHNLVEKHRRGYLEWKNIKSLPNQRFQKFSESFESFSKVSDGIGIGVGGEEGDGEGGGEGARNRAPQFAPFAITRQTEPVNRDAEVLAKSILESAKLSAGPSEISVVADQIRFEAADRGGVIQAAEFIKSCAIAAVERGEPVNIFWFKDRKFINTLSPSARRVRANLAAIDRVRAKRLGISLAEPQRHVEQVPVDAVMVEGQIAE